MENNIHPFILPIIMKLVFKNTWFQAETLSETPNVSKIIFFVHQGLYLLATQYGKKLTRKMMRALIKGKCLIKILTL